MSYDDIYKGRNDPSSPDVEKTLESNALETPKKDTKIILVDLIPFMIKEMSIFSLSQNVFRQD